MAQPAEFDSALQRAPELPEAMRVFARIEDLIGQERALLQVPDRERTREQPRRELTRRGLRSLIADLAHGP